MAHMRACLEPPDTGAIIRVMALRPRTPATPLGAQAVAEILEADGELDRRCSGQGLQFDHTPPLPPPAPPLEFEPPDWPPVADRVPEAVPPRLSALAEMMARDQANGVNVFDRPPPPLPGPPVKLPPLQRPVFPAPDWDAERRHAAEQDIQAGPPPAESLSPVPAPRRRRAA